MKQAVAMVVVAIVGAVGFLVTLAIGVTGQPAQAAENCVFPEGDAVTLNAVQKAHAKTVIDVGRQRGVPPNGWVVALATAMQESKLLNLANSTVAESMEIAHDGVGSDHDSVGVFQQRAGWGSVRERMTPTYAAGKFYEKLVTIAGWEEMPVTAAAQAVQVSGFPEAYADDVSTALAAVREIGGVELDCTKIAGSAQPAPRNPDGSWPEEGCTVSPDPTTGSGCITPRTYHMLQQAQKAGYPKPGCYRSQADGGEHPKGRACDFMMNRGGITATGPDRERGNAMAAWAVANGEALGIYYIIWFDQIFTFSKDRCRCWRKYESRLRSDTPTGRHEDHVHISMY
jgi:hypothetical protein